MKTSARRIALVGLLTLAALVEEPSRRALAQGETPARGAVSGIVLVTERDGSQHPAADAVVWLPGVPVPAAENPEIASQNKRFVPHVLAVPVGTTVAFPNLDKIYHNAFSSTAGQTFDLGLYRNGASRTRRFDAAGLVRIYCNIHAQMAGNILVVDGAFALTQANGAFRIGAVPAGTHAVRVWHERGGEGETTTVVGAPQASAVRLVLDASKFVATAHKNKRGQDYPPAALDDDRY